MLQLKKSWSTQRATGVLANFFHAGLQMISIKNNGGVLTFGDLKDAKRDCIEAEEKAAEAWRQSEAIKKAKAAAGIK